MLWGRRKREEEERLCECDDGAEFSANCGGGEKKKGGGGRVV